MMHASSLPSTCFQSACFIFLLSIFGLVSPREFDHVAEARDQAI